MLKADFAAFLGQWRDFEATAERLRRAARRARERGQDKRADQDARAAERWQNAANMLAAKLEAMQ